MELTAQSGSVIYLWLMQFLFGFVPWLVLALGIAAAALAFERFESMAKRFQAEPVDPGASGIPRILRVRMTMVGMLSSLRAMASLAILLGSGVTYMVLQLLRESVLREAEALPQDYSVLRTEPSTDFIVLCALLGIFITLGIAIVSYRALRDKAQTLSSRWSEQAASPRLLVRLYGRKTLAGIVIVTIGCFPLLALVMNLVWGLLMVVPVPTAVLTVDLPGSDMLLIVLFGVLLLVLTFAIASPTGVLASRYVAISLRQYRESHLLRSMVNAVAAIAVGLLFGLIDMLILLALGQSLFPHVFH